MARATLGRAFPEIAEKLFANLSQQQGREVVASMEVFLHRLEQMTEGAEPFGSDGPAAREVLTRRGFTPEIEEEGRALVEELTEIKEEPEELEVTAADRQKAIDDLWAWYIEWSTVARVAIKDRRMLRQLGFGPRPVREVEDEVESQEETQVESQPEPVASAPDQPAPVEAGESPAPANVVPLFDTTEVPQLPVAGNDAE